MKKEQVIEKIKSIIEKYGNFTTSEIFAETSPCINSMCSVVELGESFDIGGVGSVVYHNDIEIDYGYYSYDELSKEILDEILILCENWEVECEKTLKRIES